MRTFYVKFLKEVYEEDGGEHYEEGSMEVEIPDDILPVDDHTKPRETWAKLSAKLEVAVQERLPKMQCVNYVIDAELRS